ncbi:hypothetical protein BO71DRAFT_402463 [Aspergillus ellipticus CBS 707.79]|uniref:Uncharacterized protein n=1 Tax=Aspergillus ellipticus CBS 707.79 TaxID=1448320 RepID=A0A319CZK3_9EURO|nr:hypothetical protein BO71DRAFT_402463 [Aspergillus ellipticus CBS 707.79]
MEDVRPTARWANRMLRPLTSIHHRLEKHHEIRKSISDAKSKAHEKAPERARLPSTRAGTTTTTTTEGSCSFSDEEADDPAWIPGKPGNRRIRHNYSSRGQKNGARRRSRLLIKSPEVQRTLPGAIEIATPLITGKAQGPLEASVSIRKQLFRNVLPPVGEAGPSENRRASRTNNSNFPAYQGSWKEALDLSGDAGVVDIARFLDRMFMKFLNNTRAVGVPTGAQQDEGRRGTRSLLSMTARRLPQFIAEEQRLQDEADKDGEVDMCDAYFTELEALYAPGGQGWQPIRDAVRAQGIHLVSEVMQKGWVPRRAACRLLEECLNQGELEAFESLLSRYLTTIETYEYPPAFDPPRPRMPCDDPVHILRVYYSRVPGRRYFVFDEVAKLLSRRAFPPEWMVTARWKKCVDGAIASLSIGDGDSAAATRAIEGIVLSSAGIYPATDSLIARMKGRTAPRANGTRASITNPESLPKDLAPCPIPIQDALSNLSSSLVTALCGMCIARSQASDPDERSTGRKVRLVVGALSYTVQRAIGLVLSREEMEGLSFHALRRGYVLLGEWMLQCHETSRPEIISQPNWISPENMESFCLSLSNQHEWVKQLAEFAQQVFHCCGHARKGDPTPTPPEVQRIVSRLAQLTTRTGISLLGKVASETAMALAEITLDEDDHTWALDIQGQALSSQQEQRDESPASGHEPSEDALDLYRWEDSIGEWVASTPTLKPVATHDFDGGSSPSSARSEGESVVACSTSSRSPSPTPSETVASSVTSSAPSVSGKRGRAKEEWAPPSPKRPRSSARTKVGAVMPPSASPGIRERVATARGGEPDAAPIAARTRTALRDLPQAKNRVVQQTRRPATKRAEPARVLVPQIEVVIINRSPSESTMHQHHQQQHALHTWPGAPRMCRKGPLRPPVSPPALPNYSDRRPPAQTRAIRRRAVAVRREIACSQDDSEDELSFL